MDLGSGWLGRGSFQLESHSEVGFGNAVNDGGGARCVDLTEGVSRGHPQPGGLEQ